MKKLWYSLFVFFVLSTILVLLAIRAEAAERNMFLEYSARTAQQSALYDDEAGIKYTEPGFEMQVINERVDWDINHRRYAGGKIAWKMGDHVQYDLFGRDVRNYWIDSLKYYNTVPEKRFSFDYGISCSRLNWGDFRPSFYNKVYNKDFYIQSEIHPEQQSTSFFYENKKMDLWGMPVATKLEYKCTMPENRRWFWFKTTLEIL